MSPNIANIFRVFHIFHLFHQITKVTGQRVAKIDLNNAELAELHDELLSVLNRHAPVKY